MRNIVWQQLLDQIQIKQKRFANGISTKENFVVPANYNYKDQTVISGNELAVENAMEKLKELGAKKVIKLKTSGPFHTIKLLNAKEKYEKELENIQFNKNQKVKVIKNIADK